MYRSVVYGEPDELVIYHQMCKNVVYREADVAAMVNQVSGEQAGRVEDKEAARAEKETAVEAARDEKQAALESAEAEKMAALHAAQAEKEVARESAEYQKQAALESARADNDAALDAAKTVMTAHKESYEEDMVSLRAQLVVVNARVAELIGRVSVGQKEPDV
jgi:hypothetical protein